MYARDVMTTRFVTLKPDHTVAQAVDRFRSASREQGKNVFGLRVTDVVKDDLYRVMECFVLA